MSEILLGVDIGTSSSKGLLATAEGIIVATTERPHELAMPRPGWAEHDAETVWWDDFVAICHDLLGRSEGEVQGVCVSGIGPCLLPVDGDGNPLRPAILYGIDTRATKEIDDLTERYGKEEILMRCGSPLTSQAVGPKLLWLRRNEPEVWEKTRAFMMASSFIVNRLTGEYVLDHHSASQCDPLYDLGSNVWIDDWAEDSAPGLRLPHLLWSAEVAGQVTDRGAEATGIAVGTPVAAGTIDAWAEAASVGVRKPGDLMLMYGTTMFIVSVLAEVPSSERLWSTAGISPGTRNLAAGMATSGALTAWFRKLAGDPRYETLLSEAAKVPPGSGGLVVLPYFAGERTPLFDVNARGIICGLTLSHERDHLYRSLLEATAFGVRHNLETMEAAGANIDRIVAVGGGTKGDLWTQIVSDVTERSQELPTQTIGASYGDAWLAAVACGLIDEDSDWTTVETVIEPDPETYAVYERLYRLYRDLYPATRDLVRALAEMQVQ
jgi:xylulokinase